jgi:hypothetical protein
MEIGCCDDKTKVGRVGAIKFQGRWRTLGPRPEELACRCFRVPGEVIQQLLNGIVVLDLELIAGPENAVIETKRLIGYKEVAEIL